MYLCVLNEGIHVWDIIFRRFFKMLKYVMKRALIHSKLSFLAKLSKEDNRSVLATNISFICRKTNIHKNKLRKKNIIYKKHYVQCK